MCDILMHACIPAIERIFACTNSVYLLGGQRIVCVVCTQTRNNIPDRMVVE